MKEPFSYFENRQQAREVVRNATISFLARGGSHTAQEIVESGHSKAGRGAYLWDILRELEREGFVWRAFDYEHWQTLHSWKMTGCGRLFLAASSLAVSSKQRQNNQGE